MNDSTMVIGVLAQATVRDFETSTAWHERLFGRPPDAQPMDGLVEWHFGDGRGIQVWCEPDRATTSRRVAASLRRQIRVLSTGDAYAGKVGVHVASSALGPREKWRV